MQNIDRGRCHCDLLAELPVSSVRGCDPIVLKLLWKFQTIVNCKNLQSFMDRWAGGHWLIWPALAALPCY